MKKVSVLFVCLGNICRSPLAAAILKRKISQNEMKSGVEVDSCGTSDYHIGDNADPRTRGNATRNGIAIEHCVRQLTAKDLENFDFIFAMDKSNYQNILKLKGAQNFKNKIRMMREFDPVRGNGEVPDPYHGDEQGFQEVFEILDRSTNNFIEYLRKEYSGDLREKPVSQ